MDAIHVYLSVQSEMATFRGQEQPCRWIEIKVVTGHPSEVGIRGPVRIYKVLVPEAIIARAHRSICSPSSR